MSCSLYPDNLDSNLYETLGSLRLTPTYTHSPGSGAPVALGAVGQGPLCSFQSQPCASTLLYLVVLPASVTVSPSVTLAVDSEDALQ